MLTERQAWVTMAWFWRSNKYMDISNWIPGLYCHVRKLDISWDTEMNMLDKIKLYTYAWPSFCESGRKSRFEFCKRMYREMPKDS